MSYLEIVKKLRSKREFKQAFVEMDLLEKVIEHVRYAASARNNQILRYLLINDPVINEQIFQGSSLKSRHKISNHQQPMAYIVMGTLKEESENSWVDFDIGIATQIIREALLELDLASIPVHVFDRNKVKELANKDDFQPKFLIAIGYSDQLVNVADSDEEVGYYRDDNNIHTIRKLKRKALIIK